MASRNSQALRILTYGNSRMFSDATENEIWKRDKRLCVYCGSPGLEIDHVVPYSKGGPSIRANGVVSCGACNRSKRAKLQLEQLTQAFTHLLNNGESLTWLDEYWATVYSMPRTYNNEKEMAAILLDQMQGKSMEESARIEKPKVIKVKVVKLKNPRVSKFPERTCECGCGESYMPIRRNQRYITDHRFYAYESHPCPECGTVHRISRANGEKG